MKEYRIKRRMDGMYETMVVINRDTREEIAEYRLTPGCEASEIRRMRRVIDEHLDGGGTLGNYQW
jgi:hypothetical protein